MARAESRDSGVNHTVFGGAQRMIDFGQLFRRGSTVAGPAPAGRMRRMRVSCRGAGSGWAPKPCEGRPGRVRENRQPAGPRSSRSESVQSQGLSSTTPKYLPYSAYVGLLKSPILQHCSANGRMEITPEWEWRSPLEAGTWGAVATCGGAALWTSEPISISGWSGESPGSLSFSGRFQARRRRG